MKVGFFSDVHGNWEALSACLRDFEKEGLQKLFFLGDAIGYGADPNLTTEKIFAIAEIIILGNHDAAAIGKLSTLYFNEYARASHLITQRSLTEENIMRLKQAQLWAVWDIFHLVHALPLDPESWNYITSLREAEENFPHFITPVCLVGHSHRPFIVEQPNNQKAVFNPEQSVILADDCRYIINVGSVGQPRDGDPRACYIIYDSESRNIRFKRIKYDVLAAQEKMRRAQMPEFLVERLSTGR